MGWGVVCVCGGGGGGGGGGVKLATCDPKSTTLTAWPQRHFKCLE